MLKTAVIFVVLILDFYKLVSKYLTNLPETQLFTFVLVCGPKLLMSKTAGRLMRLFPFLQPPTVVST